MMQYDLALPQTIRFGRRIRFDLNDLLPAGSVLAVTGNHALSRLQSEKNALFGTRKVEFLAGIPPEVPIDFVDAARQKAREINACAIVGIGGGSAIDAAKAVAALADENFPTADYFYLKRTASPRRVTFAALPTTAGTGAEVTANAVLHDPATRVKQSLRTPDMAADIALVDPDLAGDAPFDVMAASGMDALTQAIESFTSLRADDLTRQIAALAAKSLLDNLEAACRHERVAVDAVCRASLLTGIAFSRSGLGAVHGLAHPLGCVKSVSHGVACAVLLGAVLKCNFSRAPESYRALSAALGYADAEKLFAAVATLRGTLNIPEKFDFALTATERDFIISHSRSGSMKCNPVFYSDGELGVILDLACR